MPGPYVLSTSSSDVGLVLARLWTRIGLDQVLPDKHYVTTTQFDDEISELLAVQVENDDAARKIFDDARGAVESVLDMTRAIDPE